MDQSEVRQTGHRGGSAEDEGDGGEEEARVGEERVGVVRPEVVSVQPYTGPATGGIVLTITGFSIWRR